MITRRRILAGAVLVGAGALGYFVWGRAGLEELAAVPVFATEGVALGGTDPVGYFTEGRPVAGLPAHSFDWNGAIWHFASAENRDAFAADPARYAPQYGGFCAWAVAEKGQLFSTQPENWAIVEGKLYLNYNDDIAAKWQADVPGFIARGDARWPEVLKGEG